MSNADQIRALLKMRRRLERRKDGSFPKFRAPKTEITWPAAVHASYKKLLIDTMQSVNKEFFPRVRAQLPSWIEEKGSLHRQDDAEIRLDSMFLDMTSTFDALKSMVESLFTPRSTLTTGVFGIGNKTNKFHLGRWKSIVEDVVQAPFYPEEPWVDDTVKEWAETNLDLVKSLTGEYIVKMNEICKSGVTEGKTYREVMDDLLKMAQGLTVRRAELIARDQLGKLHGALTKARFQEAGLEKYEWRTSQDERVRGNPVGRYPGAIPSHYAAHGMICRWGNNSVYLPKGSKTWEPRPANTPLGIPGFPIQCFLGERVALGLVPTEMLYRHFYAGKGSILVTKSGESLRCTANHPVLRADGRMIPAHLLNKGDKILQFGLERLPGVNSDHQDGVPSFQELFELGLHFGAVSRTRGVEEDFHGDGSTEDVDVVNLKGGLSDGGLPQFEESVAEEFLAEALSRLSSEVGLGQFSSVLDGSLASSNGVVGRLRQLLPFLGRGPGHSEEHRSRAITTLDSMFLQDLGNGSASPAVRSAQLQFAQAGLVFSTDLLLRQITSLIPCWSLRKRLESGTVETLSELRGTKVDRLSQATETLSGAGTLVEILENRECDIADHVYNLQNELGWYFVQLDNGTLAIVANCRCHALALWDDLVSEIDLELMNAA